MTALRPSDIIIAIVAFMLAAGVLLLVTKFSGGHARLEKRIAKLRQRKAIASGKLPSGDAKSVRRHDGSQLSPLLATLLKPLPNMAGLDKTLQRAGCTMGAKQYMFRCLAAFLIILYVISMPLHKPVWLGALVGFVVAWWLPRRVLKFRINRSYKQFLRLFPNGIDLIVRGLRSGLPVTESITLVASEVPAPVSTVFGHISDTIKLGVPMEKALQEMARRLDYTEFNFFVTSLVLQRETGGNLAEILNNLSDVLRKRIMMLLKIRAMTSEARASAVIVGVLPFMVMGAVQMMSPGYLNVLFTDPRGEKAAGVAAFMLVSGVWMMIRMGKVEI